MEFYLLSMRIFDSAGSKLFVRFAGRASSPNVNTKMRWFTEFKK